MTRTLEQVRSRRVLPGLLAAAALVALAFLPQYASYFGTLLATEILIFALFALSFNLIFGYTGLLSFGHAAFFGVGAYTSALLLRDLDANILWLLPAAMLIAGLFALVIGALSVRLSEVYFAMLTLAFGMLVYGAAHQLRGFTGGSDGVTGFQLGEVGGSSLANPTTFYYLTLVTAALATFVLYRIVRSPFGLLLRAMRENVERVSFTGTPVYRYRLYAFVLSGMFAGLAGALYGPFTRVASPDMLHWSASAEPVLMSVLGGSGVFFGPVVGAGVFLLLKDWITGFTDQWMLYLGLGLGLIVLLFPKGLLGTLLELGQGWLNGDETSETNQASGEKSEQT